MELSRFFTEIINIKKSIVEMDQSIKNIPNWTKKHFYTKGELDSFQSGKTTTNNNEINKQVLIFKENFKDINEKFELLNQKIENIENIIIKKNKKELKDGIIETNKPEIIKISNKIKEDGAMNVAIKYGFIGSGQAGGKITQEFVKLGYEGCIINTAKNDLEHVEIPENRKLCIGSGMGAAQDIVKGKEAVEDSRGSINKLIRQSLVDNKVEYPIICVGGGGGSGCGSVISLVDILHSMNFKKVGVIYTLPLDTEGTRCRDNALKVLGELFNKAISKQVAPLIIVDNNKIYQTLGEDISLTKFWSMANVELSKLFHQFNILSASNSPYTNLDPADYRNLIESAGCLVFGKAKIKEYTDKSKISSGITDNIESGLLADGFDLFKAISVGAMVLADKKVLDEIPQSYIDNAFDTLKTIIGGGAVFRGIYEGSSSEHLTVFTMFSGLGLPKKRIKQMLTTTINEKKLTEKKEVENISMDDIMNEIKE